MQLIGKLYRANGGWQADWVFVDNGRELNKWTSKDPLATVLQVLAAAGEPDASRAHAAFTATLRRILPAATVAPPPAALPALAELDAALDQLANAAPQLKRSIVAACVECAATDGKLELAEYELLRAITDSLDCPLPPLKTARS